MELKLFDSERKVMEVLWDHGDLSAKELADRLKELVGWSKTTTYTVIKKCIDKKAVSRSEPGFVCHPLVSREEVREQETDAPDRPDVRRLRRPAGGQSAGQPQALPGGTGPPQAAH